MDNSEVDLRNLIESETVSIANSYSHNDVIYGLIEIIRTLDYHTFMLGHNIRPDDELLLEKYKLGWALPFLLLYKKLIIKDVPIFSSSKDLMQWSDSVIQYSSLIQLCNQLLDYTKAGIVEISSGGERSYIFSYKQKHSSEFYERLSLAYYGELMNKLLEEKIISINSRLPQIRLNLRNIVSVARNDFITYQATEELDCFYSELGYLYMMTTQIVNEFDENDTFGGYKYKEYLDIAQFIIKSAIMHQDCCVALAEKTSHQIYLRNILTYGFQTNRFINSYGEYLGWDPNKLKEIFFCFVINNDNCTYHLGFPKSSPAPYFHFGQDIWLRSTSGCLERPIYFLNRELKRRFPKDYFNAVNNREQRFRDELYSFFNYDKLIKVRKSIVIKSEEIITDIDAAIYDTERKTLGLFQLKWQDSYHNSMKERYSRITNLIPKSVEWINRIESWIKNNNSRIILNALQINSDEDRIDDIILFVISRNNTHFTDQKLDERAVWASWYQIIEASAKIKGISDSNPIGEFATKLKFFSPANRMVIDQTQDLQNFEFNLSDYRISIIAKS